MFTSFSNGSERGQSLIVVAILIVIIVGGMILVGNAVGVDVLGKLSGAMS